VEVTEGLRPRVEENKMLHCADVILSDACSYDLFNHAGLCSCHSGDKPTVETGSPMRQHDDA
jgi:hypothetical protein